MPSSPVADIWETLLLRGGILVKGEVGDEIEALATESYGHALSRFVQFTITRSQSSNCIEFATRHVRYHSLRAPGGFLEYH